MFEVLYFKGFLDGASCKELPTNARDLREMGSIPGLG